MDKTLRAVLSEEVRSTLSTHEEEIVALLNHNLESKFESSPTYTCESLSISSLLVLNSFLLCGISYKEEGYLTISEVDGSVTLDDILNSNLTLGKSFTTKQIAASLNTLQTIYKSYMGHETLDEIERTSIETLESCKFDPHDITGIFANKVNIQGFGTLKNE